MSYRLLEEALPAKRRDGGREKIIASIREKRIATIEDLMDATGYSRNHLLKRLGELHHGGRIKQFKICRGGDNRGATKGGLRTLFGSYHNRIGYYVDDDDAAEKLLTDLDLLRTMDRATRGRITGFLHNSLPQELFKIVWLNYSSGRALNMVLSGVKFD